MCVCVCYKSHYHRKNPEKNQCLFKISFRSDGLKCYKKLVILKFQIIFKSVNNRVCFGVASLLFKVCTTGDFVVICRSFCEFFLWPLIIFALKLCHRCEIRF